VVNDKVLNLNRSPLSHESWSFHLIFQLNNTTFVQTSKLQVEFPGSRVSTRPSWFTSLHQTILVHESPPDHPGYRVSTRAFVSCQDFINCLIIFFCLRTGNVWTFLSDNRLEKPLIFFVFTICKKALCPIFQFEFRNLELKEFWTSRTSWTPSWSQTPCSCGHTSCISS
jgi:hypothetical protein